MTRLFLRFYLGVIAILVGAWFIQGYVNTQVNESQNIRVVEQALSGGARLARQRMSDAPRDQAEATLAEIRSEYEYPVHSVRISEMELSDATGKRLRDGEVIYYFGHIVIALKDNVRALVFGPLPTFVAPSQTVVTLGFGTVLALVAIAIAILLRPVASQLRAVERTATAIAEGDLSARIDGSHVPKGLPLASAFNTMANRSETLLKSQRELLQLVSHELRTPLARIRFATDLIESSKTDEERRSRLDAVDNATEELDELVGELLTYVRLESDAPSIEPERIDLTSLLPELVKIHAPLHPSIQYECDDAGENVQVTADHASLSRAIGNLLSNAGRFATERVTVSAYKQNDTIVVQVDDDGQGIPEADRDKIFDPFVRLEDATDRGAGLGLALVKRIATRHGGSISVGESPNGGARFSLFLPTR